MQKVQDPSVRGNNAPGKASKSARDPRKCTVCQCSDDDPCQPFGCAWVMKRPAALCSACLIFLLNLRDESKLAKVCKLFGLPIITRESRCLIEIRDQVAAAEDGSALFREVAR